MRAVIWFAALLFVICVIALAYGAMHSAPKTYGEISHAAEQNCLQRQASTDVALAMGTDQKTYCEAYGAEAGHRAWVRDHRDFQ